MDNFDIIKEAKNVFKIEMESLEKVKDSLGKDFENIVNEIVKCKGKVIFTGMGKPGHIAKKLAATFASLGTPSFCLHPAEAQHGDLGMISKEDIVIAISFSGESEEVTRILPNIKKIGATLIGISGNSKSTLIKESDLHFIFPPIEEACYMKIAPTSSTTAALVLGDAMAVTCAKIKAFTKKDYALFHPSGSLGKGLITTVGDLMSVGDENSVVTEKDSFEKAVEEMCRTSLGMVNVVDKDGKLVGLFTDGDLRRKLAEKVDIYNMNLKDIITTTPVTIRKDMLAAEALRIMIQGEKKVSVAPVVDENNILLGSLCAKDIIKAGIVL